MMETMVKVEDEEEVEKDIEYYTEKPPNIFCILMTIIAVLIILIFAFGPVDTPHPKDTLGEKVNKVPRDYHPVYIVSILLLPLCCLYLLTAICFGWILGLPEVEKVEVELDNNNTYAVRETDDTVDNGSKSRLKIFNGICFCVGAISVTMILVVGLPDTPHPKDTLGAMDKDNKVSQWDGSSVFTLSMLVLLITYLVVVPVNCLACIHLERTAKRVEDDDNNNTSIDKSSRQREDKGKKIRWKIFYFVCVIIFAVLIFVICTDPLHFNEMSDKDKDNAGGVYGFVLTVAFVSCAVVVLANICPRILRDPNHDDDHHSKWNREYFVSEHLLEADEAKRKNLVLHKYLCKEKVYVYYDYNPV